MKFPSKFASEANDSTGLLFIRTYHKWHSEIKKYLASLDLTHPQFIVIASLGYLMQAQEEITQIMVARQAGMDVMTTSKVAILLERKGLLERRAHSLDSRAKAIKLTELGCNQLQQALPCVEEIDKKFFSVLGVEEDSFKSALAILSR